MINSILFVPLNNEDFIENTKNIYSNFIFDLEDSIQNQNKNEARTRISLVSTFCNMDRCAIRINSLQTNWWFDDLKYSIKCGFKKIVLPKINSNLDLQKIQSSIKSITNDRIELIPIIETYIGICNAEDIITNPDVEFIIFGSEDYLADIGAYGSRGLTSNNPFLRDSMLKLALLCNRFDKFLIDPVFPFLGSDTFESLKEECNFGLSIGTIGKLTIHPSQVQIINSLYVEHYTAFFKAYLKEIEYVFNKMNTESAVIATLKGKMYGLPEIRKYNKLYKKYSKLSNLNFNSDLLKISNILLPYA